MFIVMIAIRKPFEMLPFSSFYTASPPYVDFIITRTSDFINELIHAKAQY